VIRGKTYPIFIWVACGFLVIHLLLSLLIPEPNIVTDLIMFNLVGILSAFIAANSPIHTDRISAATIALAALVWSTGGFGDV
jgi:hypothetical protein